jgi:hypothetical protein
MVKDGMAVPTLRPLSAIHPVPHHCAASGYQFYMVGREQPDRKHGVSVFIIFTVGPNPHS